MLGLPPKTDYFPLTGGYRRVPALQIGADIYCDSALVIRKLEELAPNPSVFPAEAGGVAEMIADWADHRGFRWVLSAVYPEFVSKASEAFVKDRTELIPDLEPGRAKQLAPHAFEQFKQFVALVDRALAAHAFLAGDSFSVADAACYHLITFSKLSPTIFGPVAECPRVLAWLERIAAFPPPKIEVKSSLYPLDVAHFSTPQDLGDFTDGSDAFSLGDIVTVAPDDYAPHRVEGEIVKLAPNEVAVRQVTNRLGEIAIHFPRLGFVIEAVGVDNKRRA